MTWEFKPEAIIDDKYLFKGPYYVTRAVNETYDQSEIGDAIRKILSSVEENKGLGCTRAFSHFYRQAFPNQPYKSLGVLRKTYLSYLYRETEENMIKLSSHGNMQTLETHYLDKRLIAKGAKMEMF